MSIHAALTAAAELYRERAELDREQRLAGAVKLAEHRVFSNRQIALILDLPHGAVDTVARRPERTGGRLVPEALDRILTLRHQRMNGEDVRPLAAEIVDMGVSTSCLARLSGVPQRTIARAAGKP